MRSFFVKWVEQYLFFPTPFQRLIGLLLLPFTLLYCVVTSYQRISKKAIDFKLPIISVGNLVVGGTGKTPVIIALAKRYKNSAVILRGYGRASKGLFVVSDGTKILQDIATSGDEGMLLALSLKDTIVIVSENRIEGIDKARELGAEIVFLDDGYRHHDIKKLDILLRPKEEPTNLLCLPSGGYRDTKMMYSFADIVLKEESDFFREVYFTKAGEKVDHLPKDIVLLSAISKADRLLEFLPKDIPMVIFEDHHQFTKEDIEELYKKYPNYSIVTTTKDYVKLEGFGLDDIYLMELEIGIDGKYLEIVDRYVDEYEAGE